MVITMRLRLSLRTKNLQAMICRKKARLKPVAKIDYILILYYTHDVPLNCLLLQVSTTAGVMNVRGSRTLKTSG